MTSCNGSSQPLILRHRPTSFSEIWGHNQTVNSLQRRIGEAGRPHSYLFTGPSGTGKTTLARIIGQQLHSDVMEIDAASNSGVEAMRALVDGGRHRAFNAPSRMIILDECHTLSRNAWNAALKLVEEPPDHLYLSLCTTEFFKVPETIRTRCHHVKLERLADRLIEDFVYDIMVKEGWLEVVDPEVFHLVVREAQGSPRLALSLLQACYDAPDETEARRIIAIQGSSDPLIQVVQILLGGQGRWQTVRPLLAQLSPDDFNEGAVINACRYVVGAMNREESEKNAQRYWELLSSLTYPANSYDHVSIFYSAVGRMLWSAV